MAGYEGTQIKNIIDWSVRHTWSVPEFQRGFVWKAIQVKDLMESLWLGPGVYGLPAVSLSGCGVSGAIACSLELFNLLGPR
jgi:hypothetical protein